MCWCEVFKVLSVWLADKFTVQNPMNDDTSTYLFKLYFLCTPGLESSSWRGYKQAGNTGQSPDSRSWRSAGTDSFVGALNVPLESLKVFPVLLYWALSVLKFRQRVNKNLAMQWKLRLQTANRMRKRSYSRCRNVLSELTRSHRVLCLFSKLSSSLWNRAGWSLSSSRPQTATSSPNISVSWWGDSSDCGRTLGLIFLTQEGAPQFRSLGRLCDPAEGSETSA